MNILFAGEGGYDFFYNFFCIPTHLVTTTNKGQEVREDNGSPELHKEVKIGVVNPQNPVPINLTSVGLVFLLENGEQVNVYTEDLENFLKNLIGNYMNNRDDSKYAFSLGTSKSFFPTHFLK